MQNREGAYLFFILLSESIQQYTTVTKNHV